MRKTAAGSPRRASLRRASVIGGRTGAIAIRQRGCEAKAAAAPTLGLPQTDRVLCVDAVNLDR